MLKLKTLHIKTKFKNIENLKIDFAKSNGIAVIIGNNGSGKSNILEAVSEIFLGLYIKHKKPSFSYELIYEKDSKEIKIEYDVKKMQYITLAPAIENLPSKLISIYSGEEERLYNEYYYDSYDEYCNKIIQGDINIRGYLINPIEIEKIYYGDCKMQYINKDYWSMALLTLLLSDYDDLEQFIDFNKIDNIIFNFTEQNIKNTKTFKSNEVVDFVKLISSEKYQIKVSKSKRKKNNRSTKINFQELKDIMNFDRKEIFKLLSVASFSKKNSWNLLDSIEIHFQNNINLNSLSEGQKKQILIKCATEILADENSILLLDEPDSHIHITNHHKIKDLLIDRNTNQPHSQIILTTHSPTLTNSFENENIYTLILDETKIVKIADKEKQEAINYLFGNSLDRQEQDKLITSNELITLIVEGSCDKIHIENAWEKFKMESKYKNLDFIIIFMNGADNIVFMLKAIKTSSIDFKNKIFIGIFDNDTHGINCNNKTECKYNPQNKKRQLFSIVYPKEKKKDSFTVENFYDEKYYHKAYEQAFFEQKENKLSCINDFNQKIQKRAKHILAENSKHFEKKDFENFSNLFDLILVIKNKSILNKDKINKQSEENLSASEYNEQIISNQTPEIELATIANKKIKISSMLEILTKYFDIMDNNSNYLETIENLEEFLKTKVTAKVYFPSFGLSTKNELIKNSRYHINNAKLQIKSEKGVSIKCKNKHLTIKNMIDDSNIKEKYLAIIYGILNNNLTNEDVKAYLIENLPKENKTAYNRILFAYDYKNYGNL